MALYAVTPIAVTIKELLVHVDNNFLVFRGSFLNLAAGRDLYAPNPALYLDLFKYSPTFALLFAPFAVTPPALGLLMWSALNVLTYYYAIGRLLPDRRGWLVLALIWVDVLGTTQRAQSNALVAALMVLSFLALERERQWGAATLTGVGTIIKIFPAATLPLAVFHPRRLRFATLFIVVMAILVALPLLLVSPDSLIAQYRSWMAVEAIDAAPAVAGGHGGALYGGVMQQLHIWFGVTWPNWPTQLLGTILLLLPLAIRRDRWSDPDFRLRVLCSILVYVVIFNHQAESPSFVIATTGIAIWYVIGPRDALSTGILAATLLLVSAGTSDLVPRWMRVHVMLEWRVKTLPCIAAWIVMQAELLRPSTRHHEHAWTGAHTEAKLTS